MPPVMNNNLVLLTIGILASTIFFIDTFIPLGVAGCVPYILVVLGALLLPYPSAPVIAAIACTVLTYASMAFLPIDGEWGMTFLNRSLAVSAIWTTAILGSRMKQQMRVLRHHQEQLRLDLSERQQSHLREKLQQAILHSIVEGNRSQSDILNEICIHIEQILPSAICSIMLLDENTGRLTVGAIPSGGETACTILDGLVPGKLAGACGTAVHTRETVIIEDTETDPRWEPIREIARPLGIKSCWSIPVFYDNQRILGTFAISHPQTRRPTQADLQLLETASHLVGITVQRYHADQRRRQSEERFRDLYESAPLAYLTANLTGIIRSANREMANLLGRPIASFIGQSVLDLYAPTLDGRAKAERLNARIQEGHDIDGEELQMLHNNGSPIWVSLTLRLVQDSYGNSVERRGIVKDISQRKRNEELQNLQKTALEHVVTGDSLQDILNGLCRQVERMVPQGVCSILTLDSQTQILRFRAGPSVPESLASALDGMIPGPCAGSCGTATFRSQPVYVENTSTDPLWADLQDAAQRYDIASCWSYPIFADGKQVLGSFAISSSQSHAPTSFDIQLLETASYLAGIAIQRRETEQALSEGEQRYRALYEDNPSMYFTISLEGTILSVNQFGAQQLGYTVQELLGKPVSMIFVEEDRTAAQEKLVQCMLDPQELNTWELRKVRKDGTRIWVREWTRVVKDAKHQDVLLIVCHNISEQKEAEERNHRHELAVRELYEITSSPDHSFEDRIRALLALGCQRFHLPIGLLTHKISDELELQFVLSSEPDFQEGARVPLQKTFCSAAMFNDTPISFEHASNSDWRNHPGCAQLELESYLGTRVVSNNEVYGTFCFAGREPYRRAFSDADRNFLQLMARWIGTEIERQKSEADLRANHTLMNAVLEGTTDAFFVKDLQGRYLMMNVAGRRLVNKEVADIIGKTDEDIFDPTTSMLLKEQDEKILQGGAVSTFEEEIILNGIKRTFLTTKGPYRDASSQVIGIFGNARDITQRKQEEEKLQEINMALSNAMPGISQVNLHGCYTKVNDYYANMLGYRPEELVGASWEPTIHPEDLPVAKAAYQVMYASGKGEFECRGVRKDGSIFYKHVMMVKQSDLSGSHIGHHCFMRDITERKASEDALRTSEEQLQSILDNSSAVIYVKDLQGRYLLINRTYETLFHLERGAVKGKTDFDIFPFDIAKAFSENDQKVIELGNPMEREEIAPHEDGLHTYISNKFPLRKADGSAYAICGISTDITQRKQVENRMRLHTHILESSPNGILITDPLKPDNPIIYCNVAFEEMTGYTKEEALGRNCRFLQNDDHEQDGMKTLRTALSNAQECQIILRNYKKDGTLFWNELKVAPVLNQEGDLINYIGVLTDITERKSIEDSLRVIAEATSTLTGTNFFRFLVKNLATCLNVQYAVMTDVSTRTEQTIRTLAVWNGTTFTENFDIPLIDSPCENVLKGESCDFRRSIQEYFPHTEILKTLKVESYVGHPLISQSGKVLGHLVAMDTKPLAENSPAVPILQLFAARAAEELERDKAEKALRRSEARLRQIMDLVPHFIFAKDTDGRFILANEAVAEVYGTSVHTLIGKQDSDFAQSHEEVNRFRQDDMAVIKSGSTKVIPEEKITDASGTVHYLQTTKIPFTFANSTLPAVLGVSIDITARKEAESRLREAYEQTRELSARLKAAEESERKRIARELHDEFGQMLTALKFDLSWIQRRLAEQSSLTPYHSIINKTRDMSKLTDELIQTVRRIATSLRPSILDDLGLIPALEWQTKEFRNRTGIDCRFSTELDSNTCRLESDRATALFRIAQELFTNILRHAEASRVELTLEKQHEFLLLSVNDNGRGVGNHETPQSRSLGLLGIRERVTSFGGDFLISGKSGQGTRAQVRIPVSEE